MLIYVIDSLNRQSGCVVLSLLHGRNANLYTAFSVIQFQFTWLFSWSTRRNGTWIM